MEDKLKSWRPDKPDSGMKARILSAVRNELTEHPGNRFDRTLNISLLSAAAALLLVVGLQVFAGDLKLDGKSPIQKAETAEEQFIAGLGDEKLRNYLTMKQKLQTLRAKKFQRGPYSLTGYDLLEKEMCCE